MALPDASALGLRDRVLYEGAVLTDHALRTGLASVATGASMPWALSGRWRTERRALEFYARLAERADPDEVFVRPGPADVRVEEGRPPGLTRAAVEVLRFESPYVARNPAVRRSYAAHANNTVARAQHWSHGDGPRPTLLVIHGFGASPAWFNARFFALDQIFESGWDVLLHTLPFHGSRRGRYAIVNGAELFAHGLAHLSEAVLQGVHDARVLVDHFRARGVERIGVTGLSLGGYTAALLAAAEPRLDFAVPNAAVTWMPPMIRGWFPANVMTRTTRMLAGVGDDLLERALAAHSPLTYPAVLPRDRLMIVAGLGDRLAPPEQSEMLWEHWARPEIHWFPGSHVLHFGRAAYLAAMRRLMDPR